MKARGLELSIVVPRVCLKTDQAHVGAHTHTHTHGISKSLWVGAVALSTRFTVITPIRMKRKDSQPRTAEVCFLIIFTFVACLTLSLMVRGCNIACIRFAYRTKCDKKRGMIFLKLALNVFYRHGPNLV